MRDNASPAKPIEFKGTTLSVMTAFLREPDTEKALAALQALLGDRSDFFTGEPTVIDARALEVLPDEAGFVTLVSRLADYQLQPVALRHTNPDALKLAKAAGLAFLPGDEPARPGRPEPAAVPAQEPPPPAPEPVPPPPPPPTIIEATSLVIDRPLRSGQQVYARGGDLVVLGIVSHGAELIADGNIHCYGPLRGRALAGARGNTEARIFTTSLGAELVSIAGVYRTFEAGLPANVAGKPAQIKLLDSGDKQALAIEPLVLD